MDDNQDETGGESGNISFFGAFQIAFRALRDELEIAALLSALLMVMWMIFVGSMMVETFQAAIAQAQGGTEVAPPEQPGVGIYVMSILFIYITQLPFVIWARVSTLGRRDALDGGIPALLSRALWCLWRLVCAYGYMLLVTLGLYLVIFLLALLAGGLGVVSGGIETGDVGGVAIIIGAALYLGLLYIISALMGIYLVTVQAESQDMHLNIRECSKSLGPRAWKLGGAILLGQLAIGITMVLVMLAVGATLVATGGGAGVIIVVVGLFMFVSLMMNFFFLNLAAVYADLLTD